MDFLNNIFSSLFSKKAQSVIGIDIGSSAIKIVQIRKKRGRAVLETYGELALGPYAGMEVGRATSLPKEKIAEALRDILREAKTTTVSCGVALPLSSSLISFITIPIVPEKQLADVVSLEARKYIPVPMSEIMLDFSVIPREDSFSSDDKEGRTRKEVEKAPDRAPVVAPTSTTVPPIVVKPGETTPMPTSTTAPTTPKPTYKQSQDVLVVAIHNEYINTYQSIGAALALQASFYEIEIFSSIRAVVDQGIQAVMIIDVGAQATKLYILERGLLRASHIINKGSQDITLAISKSLSITVTEAETMKRNFGLKGGPEYKELTEIITVNLDYIFYESNAALLNYQKKYMKNISKVILTGGGVLLKGFTELAKVSFQTEIVYANPFGKLETPAFLAEQFLQAGPEFAVAIGCALRRLSEVD